MGPICQPPKRNTAASPLRLMDQVHVVIDRFRRVLLKNSLMTLSAQSLRRDEHSERITFNDR